MSVFSASALSPRSAFFSAVSEKNSSRAGSSTSSFTGAASMGVRWVAGSNSRIDSIVSPKNSRRTGRSDEGG